MVKHIVMWKISAPDKEQAAQKIKQMLESLNGKIPGLYKAEVGINITPGGYDVVLYSELQDQKALEGYQVHPEHLAVKEYITSVTCGRASADYLL